MMDDVIHLLKYLEEMQAYEIMDKVKHLNEFKNEIQEYLDLMLIWFRDLLIYKATLEPGELLFKEEYSFIKNQASKVSYEKIDKILKTIDKAKLRLKANVNFDLAMELMFLEIKDNIL